MKISFNQLNVTDKPEPDAEQVKPFEEKALVLFKKCGLDETELIRNVSKPFGRILFDLQYIKLNCWRNGRPETTNELQEAKKGVLMAGTVGTGKSTAMKAMAAYLGGEYVSVPDLAAVFAKKGHDGVWAQIEEAQCWDLFLDDLGAEDDVKSYSNVFPASEIIYKRYDLWQRCGARLHISTNLSAEQIGTRYGVRVKDRLKEMMTIISCNGKSLRK